jgi:tRNA(Ile)-lysidine synthase
MNSPSVESWMLHHLREALRGVFAPSDGALVAVSGGADSLSLLHLLSHLRGSLGIRLYAATLDHGLPGEPSAAEARHVVRLAEAWGVPCSAGYVDTLARAAEWGVGVEAAARRARYSYLAQIAHQQGAAWVVTAHHADDQAETVLLHLLRGSGIEGLAGMAARAPLPYAPDLTLLRPLLSVRKDELRAYCAALSIPLHEDISNSDPAYLRNRIRHELLPALRGFNPQIDRLLTQFADIAAHEHAHLTAEAERAFASIAVRSAGQVNLAHADFIHLTTALQRRLIVWAAREVMPTFEPRYERVIAAVEACERGTHGTTIQLGMGVSLTVRYGRLIISHSSTPTPIDLPLLPDEAALLALPYPGAVDLAGGWRVGVMQRVSEVPADAARVAALVLPPGARLALRSRHEGDRFAPQGVDGTRKVNRWMIDRKIPLDLRGRVPLLTADDQIAAILWLPAPSIDRRFAPAANTDANAWLWLAQFTIIS